MDIEATQALPVSDYEDDTDDDKGDIHLRYCSDIDFERRSLTSISEQNIHNFGK